MLKSIYSPYRGILLDAYGVFWRGNDVGLFPGSKEAMEQLIEDGKIVGILSNTTQLVENEINKLKNNGLITGKHFHFLVTSGEITRDILLNRKLPFETPRNSFWLFGSVHPKFSSHHLIFDKTSYQETDDIDHADFIYVSIPHIQGEDQLNPEVFRLDLKQLIRKNLPMICPNPDRFAHEGNPPRPVVRQGSIGKMYEEMGGKVFYIGKPYETVFSVAFSHFQNHGVSNRKEILMVGDTPETDIRGANLFGISSALVTETGIMKDRIYRSGKEKAYFLPSDDTPCHFIDRFN